MVFLVSLLVGTQILCSLAGHPPHRDPPPPPPDQLISPPCNSSSVKIAAELALDKLNEHRRKGYVLGLQRIFDVHEVRWDTGVVYYLTLDVLETECHVLSRKPWKDCSFRKAHESIYGQCKVTFYINRPWRILHLYNYNCVLHPLPATAIAKICPDCPTPEDPTQSKCLEAATLSLAKFNTESNHIHYFNIRNVSRASSQWVIGPANFVEYVIQETSCSKSHPPDDLSKCSFLPDETADMGVCKGSVVDSQIEHQKFVKASCELFHPQLPVNGTRKPKQEDDESHEDGGHSKGGMEGHHDDHSEGRKGGHHDHHHHHQDPHDRHHDKHHGHHKNDSRESHSEGRKGGHHDHHHHHQDPHDRHHDKHHGHHKNDSRESHSEGRKGGHHDHHHHHHQDPHDRHHDKHHGHHKNDSREGHSEGRRREDHDRHHHHHHGPHDHHHHKHHGHRKNDSREDVEHGRDPPTSDSFETSAPLEKTVGHVTVLPFAHTHVSLHSLPDVEAERLDGVPVPPQSPGPKLSPNLPDIHGAPDQSHPLGEPTGHPSLAKRIRPITPPPFPAGFSQSDTCPGEILVFIQGLEPLLPKRPGELSPTRAPESQVKEKVK